MNAAADAAYANAAHIPDGDAYPARWARAAARFRDRCPVVALDLPYGPEARARYDLFAPEGPVQGTVIFVHGGYWRAFDRSDFSHLAAGAVAAGYRVAMPSYTLAPEARISRIAQQLARAVAQIAERVEGSLVLAGHSAGGQLVARLGCADRAGPWIGRVRRIVPISPLSNLAPLIGTTMNADLRIDADEARTESPVHHREPGVPVTVWVGGAERPAFLDQAGWLGAAWDCEVVVDADRHHFDVIEGLEQPDSPLMRAVLG